MSSPFMRGLNGGIITPQQWGPEVWEYIHTFVAGNKPNHQQKCQNIRELVGTLPCPKCREHSQNLLKALPPEKAPDLVAYMWCFHNMVNMITKKEPKFMYECRGGFDPDESF